MQYPRQDLTNLFVEVGKDWSSKAIITALARKGVSLRSLEKQMGLSDNSIRNVFYRKVDLYQSVIASEIGVEPSLIWPSRYTSTPAHNLNMVMEATNVANS